MKNTKVGDYVVLNQYSGDFAKTHSEIYKIESFENELETLAVLRGLNNSEEVRSSTEHLVLAKDEEIKVGNRIIDTCCKCFSTRTYKDGICNKCGLKDIEIIWEML